MEFWVLEHSKVLVNKAEVESAYEYDNKLYINMRSGKMITIYDPIDVQNFAQNIAGWVTSGE